MAQATCINLEFSDTTCRKIQLSISRWSDKSLSVSAGRHINIQSTLLQARLARSNQTAIKVTNTLADSEHINNIMRIDNFPHRFRICRQTVLPCRASLHLLQLRDCHITRLLPYLDHAIAWKVIFSIIVGSIGKVVPACFKFLSR
jgi:hypothetical protein